MYFIPAVFHNGSNYDYHFIIKELANGFVGKFEYLGKNTGKYKTFSVPIEKKIIKIDKDGNKSVVATSCKIKLIDSARFMSTLLLNLVDKLTERTHKIKCKDCDCFLEHESVKDNSINCKCLSCNKNYPNKIDEEMIEKFKNT